jgi:tRNA1Val (adenine37-N6)-methyltransferase
MIASISKHLTVSGLGYLVLPLETAELARNIASENGLFIKKIIGIHSYKDSAPHREILALSLDKTKAANERFVIYDNPKVYSKQYQELLKDFFIVF